MFSYRSLQQHYSMHKHTGVIYGMQGNNCRGLKQSPLRVFHICATVGLKRHVFIGRERKHSSVTSLSNISAYVQYPVSRHAWKHREHLGFRDLRGILNIATDALFKSLHYTFGYKEQKQFIILKKIYMSNKCCSFDFSIERILKKSISLYQAA